MQLTLIHLLTHLFIFVFYFLFFCSLSIRKMHLPPVLYYLMSPSLRYVSFLSFCIINSYAFLSSSFFFSFFFFWFPKASLSLSPYITLQLRSFLPPWAHLWKVSLMGLMWYLRSWLLPHLLLYREFLLRLLLSLPLSRYP